MAYRSAVPRPKSATYLYLESLQGAFLQNAADRALLNLDYDNVSNLNGNIGFANRGDLASEATGGHNLVTLGQGAKHLLGFLGTLHLRTDQHEVKQDNQHHQRQELEQGAGLLRGRLGVSRAKNKIQHLRLRYRDFAGKKMSAGLCHMPCDTHGKFCW